MLDVIVKVVRKYLKEGSKILAFADISLGGLVTVRSLRIIEREDKGLVVLYPDKLNKRTNLWEEIVTAESIELRKVIEEKVIAVYKQL